MGIYDNWQTATAGGGGIPSQQALVTALSTPRNQWPVGSPEWQAQQQANPVGPTGMPYADAYGLTPGAYPSATGGSGTGSNTAWATGGLAVGPNASGGSSGGGSSGGVSGSTGGSGGVAGATGGASNNPMGSIAGAFGGIPGVGGLASGALGSLGNAIVAPNTYNANANLALSEIAAGNVYNAAMTPTANAPTANITSRDVAAPTINAQTIAGPNAINAQSIANPTAINAQSIANPTAINAQTVQASDLIQGQTADAQRAAILQQAQTAANSPSSAAAQMRAAEGQIENQQAGLAAQARGADRAGARRDAMLATGTQEQGAAATTAALAAQEQAAKQQAYTAALTGVRAGDVSAASQLAQIGQANQAANLGAQTTTQAQALQAAQANQGANLTAQTTTQAQLLQAAQANQGANLTAQGQTAANTLATQQANQQANLTGQIQQGAQGIQAGTANQQANLQAQNLDVTNKQTGYVDTQNAQIAKLNTANQAVGATNQAQGVAATYGAGQNALQGKTGIGLVGLGSSALGVSDERAKTDIGQVGDSYLDSMMSSTHGTTTPDQMTAEFGTPDLSYGTGLSGSEKLAGALRSWADAYNGNEMQPAQIAPVGKKQDFLDWRMPQPPPDKDSTSGIGGLLSGLGIGTSDERAKVDVKQIAKKSRVAGHADELARAYGLDGGKDVSPYPMVRTSDERAKRQVEAMGDRDLVDWADRAPLVAFRYQSGIEDGGAYPHVGTTAQALERTGPLGRMMVQTDPETGLKKVDYGALAYATAKAALAKADENREPSEWMKRQPGPLHIPTKLDALNESIRGGWVNELLGDQSTRSPAQKLLDLNTASARTRRTKGVR